MSSMEPLSLLIGINASNLTKEEGVLLEAELFVRICEELKEIFRKQYRNYFFLMKFTYKKENSMLESKFIQFIINDILATKEYNLKGIAYYTDTFEEVIVEMMTGRNESPSAIFLRRLIELHRVVRRDLYDLIMQKIATKYFGGDIRK